MDCECLLCFVLFAATRACLKSTVRLARALPSRFCFLSLGFPSADGGSENSGMETVLIVDDEEMVNTLCELMLERLGFNVLTARDGREGLSVFREHADEIDCVLFDLTMPHMDGKQTFSEMRQIKPDISVILCSGYDEQDATRQFDGKGLAGFIQKPFTLDTLKAKLEEVLPA